MITCNIIFLRIMSQNYHVYFFISTHEIQQSHLRLNLFCRSLLDSIFIKVVYYLGRKVLELWIPPKERSGASIRLKERILCLLLLSGKYLKLLIIFWILIQLYFTLIFKKKINVKFLHSVVILTAKINFALKQVSTELF